MIDLVFLALLATAIFLNNRFNPKPMVSNQTLSSPAMPLTKFSALSKLKLWRKPATVLRFPIERVRRSGGTNESHS